MSRRLLVSYLTLTVVVLLALEVPLGFQFARSERRDLIGKIERDGFAAGSLAEDTLESRSNADRPALQALVLRYRRDTGGRLVIVGRRGISIADSQPAEPGERNFSTRPEIVAALRGRVATGTRYEQSVRLRTRDRSPWPKAEIGDICRSGDRLSEASLTADGHARRCGFSEGVIRGGPDAHGPGESDDCCMSAQQPVVVLGLAPLFEDRAAAGRCLAAEVLRFGAADDPLVVGLARGGVVVAAEVARELGAELDVVAVRKIGHPWQPEYAIGAVVAGQDVYLSGGFGLTRQQRENAAALARARAEELDQRLHRGRPPSTLEGRTCILVDDGLATGATMVAAIQWARAAGAAHVVAAVPVAAAESVLAIRRVADEFICLHELHDFGAVGPWYRDFDPVTDEDLERLLTAR